MLGTALANFPGAPSEIQAVESFVKFDDIANYEWTVSGHEAPQAINDVDGGGITLGSGSANSSDYVLGQAFGASVRMNRTAKQFKFLTKWQLSDATLNEAMFGWWDTNTNPQGTNVVNGIFFYTTGTGAVWNVAIAAASTVQFVTYNQGLGVAVADLNAHSFGIRVFTDSNTVGIGSVVFFMDGAQVGPAFNNITLPSVAMRRSLCSGNYSAVAQASICQLIAQSGQV